MIGKMECGATDGVFYKDPVYCKRSKTPFECESEQELLEETLKDITHRSFHKIQRIKVSKEHEKNHVAEICFQQHRVFCKKCNMQCSIHLCEECIKKMNKIEEEIRHENAQVIRELDHITQICTNNNATLWKQLHA